MREFTLKFMPLIKKCGPCTPSGKELGYGLDDSGSNPDVGGVEFSSLLPVQTGPGSTQPRIKWVSGAFPEGKDGRA